jgi:hypothetical protein
MGIKFVAGCVGVVLALGLGLGAVDKVLPVLADSAQSSVSGRCVATDLVLAPLSSGLAEETSAVRSNRHARLWFVATRYQDSSTAVWAVDDLGATNWIANVNDTAQALTPEYAKLSPPNPPDSWATSRGTQSPGSWRSDVVGVTPFTDGASEAYECVRRDGLYS